MVAVLRCRTLRAANATRDLWVKTVVRLCTRQCAPTTAQDVVNAILMDAIATQDSMEQRVMRPCRFAMLRFIAPGMGNALTMCARATRASTDTTVPMPALGGR